MNPKMFIQPAIRISVIAAVIIGIDRKSVV